MPGQSWRWWRRQPQLELGEAEGAGIGSRILHGVPDAFSGTDYTTYAAMRQMAVEVRDQTWRTPVEKGLAISVLAVIADLERTLFRVEDLEHELGELSR